MKQQGTLLLVDDDRHVLASMADWLRDQGYDVDTATNIAEGRAAVDRKPYDLVLLDIRLGEEDGFDLLAHCRKNHPKAAVVMITGYGTVDSAVEAIRLGAFDFLTKPLIDDELLLAIERALNQQKVIEENNTLKAQLDMRFGMENIVGHDHRMLKIFDVIDTVADTRATVLITGESGTGKSLIARAIHRRRPARQAVRRGRLRRAARNPAGKRTLRPRRRGLHRRDQAKNSASLCSPTSGTIFLDEISTASRRHAGQTAPRAAGPRVRAGRREQRPTTSIPA